MLCELPHKRVTTAVKIERTQTRQNFFDSGTLRPLRLPALSFHMKRFFLPFRLLIPSVVAVTRDSCCVIEGCLLDIVRESLGCVGPSIDSCRVAFGLRAAGGRGVRC